MMNFLGRGLVKSYLEANKYNLGMMKHEKNKDYKYEWASDDLDAYCIAKVPRLNNIYHNIEDTVVRERLATLTHDVNIQINEYNNYKNNLDKLTSVIDILATYIKELDSTYYLREFELQRIRDIATMNRSLLISGPGGIGKSFYLNEVAERLDETSFLCLFGKYEKNITDINWDDIEHICNDREFTVIVDAINEFSENHKNFICKIKNKIQETNFGRVIISYRTNTLSQEEITIIEKNMNEFIFGGISYEDAVIKLMESTSAEISDLEFILDTNNPLMIEMLRKILVGKGITNDKLSSILLITHIFENYIKLSLSPSHWSITKLISDYFYRKETVYISETEVTKIIPSKYKKNFYISDMLQLGFLDQFQISGEMNFVFRYQSLSDFVVARSMFEDISGKSNEVVIKIINRKIEAFYSMKDIFLVLLFDKYHKRKLSDFLYIYNNSDLSRSIDEIEFLTKIRILNNDIINDFQQNFTINYSPNLFYNLAGRVNKPFNCVNFLNEKLLKENCVIQELYNANHYSNVQNRLYNSIYFLNRFDPKEGYVIEKFWFSFWSLGSRKPRERVLAEKLLLDIVNMYPENISVLIENYHKVTDDYIQSSIIKVLYSTSKTSYNEISDFFKKLESDVNMIDRNSLYYISKYFKKNNDGDYINYKKRNLYVESKNDNIIDPILKYLHQIEFNKNYLIGMDYHRDYNDLSFNEEFLNVSKKVIRDINKYSNNYFSCLLEGDCKVSDGILPDVIRTHFPNTLIKKLDGKRYYLAWQRIFIETLSQYNFSLEKLESIPSYSDSIPYHRDFKESVIWKLIRISTEKFYGSLMCNYYHGDFITYETGDEKVGYKAYSRHREEYQYNLNKPVSIFNEFITKLENKSLSIIKSSIPENKTIKWAHDYKLSQKNLMDLVKPIYINDEKWIMISGSIRVKFENPEKTDMPLEYSDEYINISMCIGKVPKLTKDNRRSLVLEKYDYLGNIDDYKNMGFSFSTEMPNLSEKDSLIRDTSFTMPPSEVIRYFDLRYDNAISSWYCDKEKVITVNNNPSNWYRDEMTKAVYIKEKYYELLKKEFKLSFLAFTERFHLNTGYGNDSAIFANFDSDNIFDYSFNYKNEKHDYININNSKCDGCENKRPDFNFNELPKILFKDDSGNVIDYGDLGIEELQKLIDNESED